MLQEVFDVHGPERLSQLSFAGVEEIVYQSQRPQNVYLAAGLIAYRLLGDGKGGFTLKNSFTFPTHQPSLIAVADVVPTFQCST